MKKTLALILSLLAMLIPVSALELDVAEAATENVSVAEEVVLSALPETTDATYGDLIYFSDFDDNTNWVNTDVVGESATASYQLAYVQKGIWGSNIVTDPEDENGNVQELTVADHNYNWATGFNMSMKNVTLNNAVVTMVWDVYFPTPVTENFRVQTTAGWADITSADYDGEAGGWQTIVMEVPGAVTVSNSEYGSNFICNDGTRNVNKSATAGLIYYVDNVKVYAKAPKHAEKPASVDLSLGNLIYFDNGNSADAVSSDKIGVYGVSDLSVVNGYYAKKVYRNTDVEMLSPGIVVKAANGTFVENGFYGTLTLVTDVYSSSELSYYKMADISSYGWEWGPWYAGSSVKSNVAYPTLSAALKTTGTAASGFGIMRAADSGEPYTRSVAVYYLPANYIFIGDTLVDLNGLTEYTLPAFDTDEYDCYKDANGKFYDAGKAYAVADINGKVFTPYLKPKYSEKVADVSLGRGILVYFDNGNAADFYSNINATLVGFGNKKVTDVDGYFTRDLSGNTSAGISGTVGIGLDTGNTETKLAYADGTDMKGAIYLVVDMYNNSDANNSFYRAVRTKWDSWCGVGTDWVSVSAVAKQWTNVADAFDSELSFIGFADTDAKNWQGCTFRRVYAYYMPQTHITLNDAVNPQVIDLNNKTEYTFPAISDGNTVWAGQDGSYYFPGDVAAAADINGVTFDTANFNTYAPETEAGVELRLTSNKATNGIRFKASIAPSEKAEANEIGFIVAREDILEHLDAELTFGLTAQGVETAEGTLFVKGVAYDAATGKDIVADINTDGSEVFTAVCVGLDIENKSHVTSTLVARPYLKMTVNETEVTVYGAVNSASLASAVSDLMSAVESGDEDAAMAYEGAKEYVDTVIATAE